MRLPKPSDRFVKGARPVGFGRADRGQEGLGQSFAVYGSRLPRQDRRGASGHRSRGIACLEDRAERFLETTGRGAPVAGGLSVAWGKCGWRRR
jgi:hypothetical protein